MRGSATLIAIFIASLLFVGVAEANTETYRSTGLVPGGLDPELNSDGTLDDTLCKVYHNEGIGNAFAPLDGIVANEWFLYSGQDENVCGRLSSLGDVLIDFGSKFEVSASADFQEQGDEIEYPTLKLIGAWHSSSGTDRPVIGITKKTLGERPTSGWYTFLAAGQCTNRLTLEFNSRTNMPDITRQIVHQFDEPSRAFARNEADESSERCRDQVFAPAFGYPERFQGLFIGSDSPYELPLFCENIAVEVTHGHNGVWDDYIGNYDFDGGNQWTNTGSQWYWQIGNANDYAKIVFDGYDEDTGILRKFTIQTEDGGGEAGGIAFRLKCDAYDPTERKLSCEALNYGWKEGAGCCHPGVQGASATADDGVDYYCNDNNAWVLNDAVSCTTADGEKLPSDDEAYCCAPEQPDENKPHHIDETDESPWFCSVDDSGGDLISAGTNAQWRASEPYDWAWDGTTWELCDVTKELSDNPTHGVYLCTTQTEGENGELKLDPEQLHWEPCECENSWGSDCGKETFANDRLWYCAPPESEDGEPYWTSERNVEGACQEDDAINGRCCYRGMHFVEIDTEGPGGDTLACFRGQVISEAKDSAAYAGPTADVYVEDPTA